MNKSYCASCGDKTTSTHSKTTTITETKKDVESEPKVLRLVVQEPPSDAKVTWSDDTVNNEGLGRKSSKRKCFLFFVCLPSCVLLLHSLFCFFSSIQIGCCIYHKVKKFGDSDSDESDSDIETAEEQSRKGDRRRIYQRHHA